MLHGVLESYVIRVSYSYVANKALNLYVKLRLVEARELLVRVAARAYLIYRHWYALATRRVVPSSHFQLPCLPYQALPIELR